MNAYAVAAIVGAVFGYLYGWRRGLRAGAWSTWVRTGRGGE
jgi:hypothetical protein